MKITSYKSQYKRGLFIPQKGAIQKIFDQDMSYVYEKYGHIQKKKQKKNKKLSLTSSVEAIINKMNSLKTLDMPNFFFHLCQQRDM